MYIFYTLSVVYRHLRFVVIIDIFFPKSTYSNSISNDKLTSDTSSCMHVQIFESLHALKKKLQKATR